MKVLFVLAALVAVTLAEDMMAAESYPVASYQQGPAVSSYHQGPALAASSAGHAYGAHGARSVGYGAHGASNYGNQGVQSDRAHAARGHHNIGGSRAHDAYGAQASSHGRYRNVGAYAQDKGSGYEKAYAYDKKAGQHAIIADHGARSGQYGVRDRNAYINQGAQASAGHNRYGAHNIHGANAYGVRAHDNSAHGRYGSGHSQSLQVAPAVSHGYASPAVSHGYAAPVHGYSRY